MNISLKSRKNLILMITLMFFAGFISRIVQGNVTGNSPFNSNKQKKQKVLVGRLSDIKVVNVRLNSKCQIIFRLQNKGKQKMSALEHSKGVVRVYFGKSHEDFFLSKISRKGKTAVDPRGMLRNPNGNVSYNTRILLNKQQRVGVIVVHEKNLFKLKYSGVRLFTLTPTCLPSGPGKGKPVKPGIRKTIKSATLISPNGGEHIEGVCDGIGLRWRYAGNIADIPSTWRVELRRGGTLERSTTVRCDHYTDHSGYRECRATFVHSCVPEGDYKIHISGIERTGSVVSDESDNTFHIGMTSGWASIVISSPSTGERYARGGDLLIRWWSTGPIRPAIAIMRGDSVVLPVPLRGRVSVDSRGMSIKTVRIPDDFAIGDNYRVRVTNSNNPANKTESGFFSIRDYAPDFSFNSSLYATERNHLGVQIMARLEPLDPEFAGPLTFRIDKGEYNRTNRTWSHHTTWNVTLRITSAGAHHIDLGDMRATRDFPCGIDYQVTIDSPNNYFERDETNNVSRVTHLFYRTDYGTINCYETTDQLGFRVIMKNCGRNDARGSVRIRQVGSWPAPGALGATPHDVEIYNYVVELYSGYTRTIGSSYSSVSFHSVPSTIYIYFSGDFASWPSRNPVVLRIGARTE